MRDQIAELKLGKNTTALYAEAKTLHGQLDRYAYEPPPVRIGDAEIDQARAGGVLLELDRTQVILDRAVYRGLVKAACRQCRGVWLDRGELDRSSSRSGASSPASTATSRTSSAR